jgi:hypothetical protein
MKPTKLPTRTKRRRVLADIRYLGPDLDHKASQRMLESGDDLFSTGVAWNVER